MKRTNRFTLIELLVVIAIIGILVTLLMPALSKARYVTKNAVCLSDQSQFAKVLMMQADGNNNRLHPATNSGASPHDTDKSFVEDMGQMGMSPRNFMCVFRKDEYADEDWLKGLFNQNRSRIGFAYWVLRDSLVNPDTDLWSSPIISQNTSDHILLSDTMFIRDGDILFDESWGTVHYGYNTQNQGMNKIYADGHGKIFQHTVLSTIYTTHVKFYGKK